MGRPGRTSVAKAVVRTAVGAGLVAAPVVGAVKGAEYLATHSAMAEIEKAQAKREQGQQQGQP